MGIFSKEIQERLLEELNKLGGGKMIQTTCPECGAKCRRKEVQCMCFNYMNIPPHMKIILQAIPQPDLSKLREAFNNYIDIAISPVDNLHEELDEAVGKILTLVKEVLDEQDNCICNSTAMEPNELCPKHGIPKKPEQCKYCGKFLGAYKPKSLIEKYSLDMPIGLNVHIVTTGTGL